MNENPRGSQEVSTVTMGVRNNIKVLEEILDVFLEELSTLPLEKEVDHAIELTPRVAPISRVPYQHFLLETNELEAQIKDLLEKGYIQPNKFSWGVSVLFKKKTRWYPKNVCEYRWLNKFTIKNKFPLPHINYLFDYLCGT